MEETLEQMQARHRKEQRDVQSRITNKKKNATKKTRKSVNDECAELERQLRERQEEELRALDGGGGGGGTADVDGADTVDEADGLAAALQAVSGSEPAGQDQDQGERQQRQQQQQEKKEEEEKAGGGTGGGGKKRNRQKERLARRAAEVEAAAAAAETEAAGMVDRRGVERAYMEAEFQARALRERDIAPDGHCLFSAVADQLAAHGIAVGGDAPESSPLPYRAVRRAAAAYMEAHADEFAGFLEEPLGTYAARIRDTAEWGGQLELSALANAYGVEIRVVQDGRTEVVRPHEKSQGGEGRGEGQDELKTLWLAYYRHGYGLGEHYNSLRSAA